MMKSRFVPTSCVLAAILLVLFALPVRAEERYFDAAPAEHKEVRLVVFYPAVGTIRCLEALRNTRLMDIPELVVIGVYHVRELTDYSASIAYVRDNGIGWFKFHPVSAEISPETLFRKNGCSPEFEAFFAKADGVLLFGGPDIPPAVFGKKTSLLTEIEDPYRHYFELSAVFHLLGGSQDKSFRPLLINRPRFPIMAFCLGFQTLVVGTGGTLVQDIWAETYGATAVEDAIALGPEFWHNNPYARLYPEEKLSRYFFHSLDLRAGGKFCAEFGFKASDHPRILSSHHQAAGEPGMGWKTIATSRDGKVVEAAEHAEFPKVLGVQFHPESFRLWDESFKVRFTPQDKEPTSLKALLEGAPPSLEFHKKIWAWFTGALKESRERK